MITDIILKEKSLSNDSICKDSAIRSFTKALSWRVLGTLDTILISFLLTDNVSIAFSIGGIELFSKMTLYFFHERIWERIKWGRSGSTLKH